MIILKRNLFKTVEIKRHQVFTRNLQYKQTNNAKSG